MPDRAADWYPDPAQRGYDMRYFDGAKWTAHVSKGGQQSSDPAGVEAAAAAESRGWNPLKPSAAARESVKGAMTGLVASKGSQAIAAEGAILQVVSREEGRNSRVTLYPDRIERVKEKAFGSLSRARQDTEVTPIRSVSSVQAKKAGLRTNVIVYASGNTIEFRLGHDEAQRFKDSLMKLVLAAASPAPAAPAAAPVAAGPSLTQQLKELGELRDSGVLTEEEFSAQKAKLLNG